MRLDGGERERVTDALLFCGGEGSRLRADGIEVEKPLVEVGGRPMLERALSALRESRVERVGLVVSPAAPATRDRAHELASEHESVHVVETPGEGYVEDLTRALDAVGRPALTVASDLPLLTPAVVERALDVAESSENETSDELTVASLTVCVPAALKRRLGVSVDTAFVPDADATVWGEGEREATRTKRELAPTGLNVVGEGSREVLWVSHDPGLTVNVNRADGLAVARARANEGSEYNAGGEGEQ